MYLLFRRGVEILKHGRSGKPKPRALFCNMSMTKLYWREPGSVADILMDDANTVSGVASDVKLPGGRSAPRSSFTRRLLVGGKSDEDRVLLFRDIIEVPYN
jgi:hypothetical protein